MLRRSLTSSPQVSVMSPESAALWFTTGAKDKAQFSEHTSPTVSTKPRRRPSLSEVVYELEFDSLRDEGQF